MYHCMIILDFRLPYFHVSNNALFLTLNINVVLTLSISMRKTLFHMVCSRYYRLLLILIMGDWYCCCAFSSDPHPVIIYAECMKSRVVLEIHIVEQGRVMLNNITDIVFYFSFCHWEDKNIVINLGTGIVLRFDKENGYEIVSNISVTTHMHLSATGGD